MKTNFMDNQELKKELSGIVHPELKQDIVSAGIVESVETSPDRVAVVLNFPKARDPFALSIRKAVERVVRERCPDFTGAVSVVVKEAAPKKVEKTTTHNGTERVKNIIAVSSGKGGVGKSTVAANLGVALAEKGFRVGVLDADIYGPSMPKMFGLEDYQPLAAEHDGKEYLLPAQRGGIEIMSIGFFIPADQALIWRGGMATNALRQLIHQTRWGELDFLLIDMPPGTGDIHLTLVQELAVTGAVIVSTPQQVALTDVVRGIKMYRAEGVQVPVLGLVENMAWFTPAELPDNRYYLFGEGGCRALAEKEGIPFIGEIPLVQSVSRSGDAGEPVCTSDPVTGAAFSALADRLLAQIEYRNKNLPGTRRVEVK